MKTYTLKEYQKRFLGRTRHDNLFFHYPTTPEEKWNPDGQICLCIKHFGRVLDPPLAYEDCKNCHGHGIAPITWSEVR